MTITTIGRDFLNNVSIVGFTTTDSLATVSSANYIRNQQPVIDALNKGAFTWLHADTLIVNASDGNAFYEFTDDTFSSLVLLTSPTGGTVSPGLINQVAYYPATGNAIAGTSTLPALVQIHPANINSGVNASGSTFLRGDGVWALATGSINFWVDVIGTSQAALIDTGYVADNAGLVTITLPAIAPFGSVISVQGKGAGGWSVVANAGQTIHVGNTASSVAGSLSSTNQWDCIELVCVTANTTWAARSMIGNLTIT
jgi:hypothetical protein